MAFKIAKNRKYDGYQRGLASMFLLLVYKFLEFIQHTMKESLSQLKDLLGQLRLKSINI